MLRKWILVIPLLLATPATVTAAVPGPLKVSSNGRYLVDGAGTPFFWLGDTAWPLFVEYPKAVAETYLRNRARKGFTVIQGVLAWMHGGTGFEKGDSPQPNVFGQKVWTGDDPARPNDAFFRHVDHLVRFAEEQSLVLAILPTWGYFVFNKPVITAEKARVYGRWLGARYHDAANVVWVLGGDRPGTGFEAVWREMAAGLREGGARQLISYHPNTSSAEFFASEQWIDFHMIQTWTQWPRIHPAVMSDILRTPNKPVVLAEGAYENGPEYPLGPITPLIVRRQAWWSVMAGGFHTYGQDQMWRLQTGWEKTFDTPGAGQVAVMKKVVTGVPWTEMVPDQALFAGGVSSEQTLNTAVRSVKQDWALVYLASQTTVSLALERLGSKAIKEIKATWINPTTGERKDAGLFPRRKQPFTTPDFWQDAVVLLETVR